MLTEIVTSIKWIYILYLYCASICILYTLYSSLKFIKKQKDIMSQTYYLKNKITVFNHTKIGFNLNHAKNVELLT